MGLTNVWLETLADGLLRADQITGINARRTPEITGKPPHWLLHVVLPAPIGSGTRDDWSVEMLHRTLLQTPDHPGDAPAELARLLSQLDMTNAAGIVSVVVGGPEGNGTKSVRFRFTPFSSPLPGEGTDAEYL